MDYGYWIIGGMNRTLSNSKLHVFYEWLVTLSGAAFFLFSGLMMSLLSLFFKPFLRPRQAHWLGRYGMHYLTKMFFAGLRLSGLVRVDFNELDRLREERSLIIAPNHPCLMDALFVSSRLPNVVCVMKASIISNPVLFGCASLGGFIRSDSPRRFVQQCQDALDDGAQLLLFPEGTRTVVEPVNDFKGGFSLVASKTGVPVQTVFIQANTPFLGKYWRIWKKPTFPLLYRISLGERFQVDKDQDHRAFTARLENYFKSRLKEQTLLK